MTVLRERQRAAPPAVRNLTAIDPVKLLAPARAGTHFSRAPVPWQARFASADPAKQTAGPDPYQGCRRILTAEGGIAIEYRDIQQGGLQAFFRVMVWIVATILTAIMIAQALPDIPGFAKFLYGIGMAIIYAVILMRPPETTRTVEIRPDCMIIDGEDLFWLAHMEVKWPLMVPDDEGNRLLIGIYGTRLVEFLTVRIFDEFDCTPLVVEANLASAMQQLWGPAASGIG